MSRKLGIAGLTLLVCGFAAVMLATRSAPGLTVAFVRLHSTNSFGVTAQIRVNNTTRDAIEVTIAGANEVELNSHGPPRLVPKPPFRAAPSQEWNTMIYLRPEDKPWRLIAKWQRCYDPSLMGRMRSYFEHWLPRKAIIIDIP